LNVRQSQIGNKILHRFPRVTVGAASHLGTTDLRVGSTGAQYDMKGLASNSNSDHQASLQPSGGQKVSYYFTNIPECLPIFLLRRKFEVCGILTDVFVARQWNVRGQVFGFVRFSNVKNADKLSQALNNVWFGHMQVWAKEARFDRFAVNDKKSLVVSKNVRRQEVVVGCKG